MAKSRQQLIQGSSFLSDQKEKIGGLNVKKSTISGDAFKKGTPLEKRARRLAIISKGNKKLLRCLDANTILSILNSPSEGSFI